MRILIDQDEVLACWLKRILEWYNQDYGTSLRVDDIKSYWMDGMLGPQGRDFVRSCIRWPDLYTNLEPVAGAVDGMKSLLYDGHDVIIVSSVPTAGAIAYHGKLEWLRKHMPFFPLKNFIATSRKDLITGDLLFDDAPHNIEAFVNAGRRAVVMDAPYNQNVTASARVKTWGEFLKYVDEIKEGAK